MLDSLVSRRHLKNSHTVLILETNGAKGIFPSPRQTYLYGFKTEKGVEARVLGKKAKHKSRRTLSSLRHSTLYVDSSKTEKEVLAGIFGKKLKF